MDLRLTTAPHQDVTLDELPLGRPIKRRVGRRVLLAAVLAAACLGLALHRDVKYYNVTSGSMEPTLHVGDRIAVDPGATMPQVGQIVVFHPPQGAHPANPVCGSSEQGTGSTQPCGIPTPQQSSAVFIKRVVAGPGSTIAIVAGRAVVDGRALTEPYASPCDDRQTCSFPSPISVPTGEYYLLGDNRAQSDDSRFWGPVPSAWIVGTAVRCSLWATICHPIH
jgi:signal peptidase I